MLGLVAKEDGDSHRAQAYFSQSLELYQAVENRIGAAYALCGLAGIHEQPEQRAQMLADASVVLEATRLPFDQIERDHYARMMG